MKRFLLVLLLTMFIVACYQQTSQNINPKKIELKTSDDIKISGIFRANQLNTTAVIFLHMLNGKKEDWENLNNWTASRGYTTLAIDFRGHGESQGDLKNFDARDYKKMLLDVAAAKNFLKEKGYKKIAIGGASIGANVALRYSASDPEIKKVVLFSPGENYKGITTLDVLNNYKGELYIFSPQQLEDENKFAFIMKDLFKGEKSLRVLNGDFGHGTKMIENYNSNTYPDFEYYLRR